MSDTKALSGTEAIAKMKHIAKDEIAMLGTTAGSKMHVRPMATMGIDDEGNFYFFSKKGSTKNLEIAQNAQVHLVYSVPSKSEFLSIEGKASVGHDQKKIDELWSPMAKAWFTGGKEDPELTVITVTPKRGHYWDTKYGQMVTFAAIAVGAVTGIQMDAGIEGALKM